MYDQAADTARRREVTIDTKIYLLLHKLTSCKHRTRSKISDFYTQWDINNN